MTVPYEVVLDPSEVATARTELSLSAWHSGSHIGVTSDGIDWGDAAIQEYLADQQVGSTLVAYRLPNRSVTIPLFVGSDPAGSLSDFQTAREQLQQKVGLIQREGGWLKRGDTGLYADVVNATLTKPDQYGETGGIEPNVKLVLECLPDFYADEITLDAIACTGICDAVLTQSGVQAAIAGDYPARCRIAVSNPSNSSGSHGTQLGAFWGLRSRHYSSDATAALVYEAHALAIEAGNTAQTLSDSADGTVVGNTAGSTLASIIGLTLSGSALTHLGRYRVLARVWGAVTGAHFQLVWTPGLNLNTNTEILNDMFISGQAGFALADLGTVSVDPTPFGDARWTGLIKAGGLASGQLIAVDQVYLVPLDEGSGIASSPNLGFVYPTLSAEIRTEGAWSVPASGGGHFQVQQLQGDLPRIPPSGLEGRPAELLFRPSTGAVVNPENNDASLSTFTVQVTYRPSYMFPA